MHNPMLYLLFSVIKMKGNRVLNKIEKQSQCADQYSEKLLLKLIDESKDTEYGKKYHFDRIHSIEDYKWLA